MILKEAYTLIPETVKDRGYKSKTEQSNHADLPKINHLNHLINYFDNKLTQYPDMPIDKTYLRFLSFACKTKKDFYDKLMSEQLSRNSITKESIKLWYNQSKTIILVKSNKPIKNKCHDLPIVKQNTCEVKQKLFLRKCSFNNKQEVRKKITVPLQQIHCPVSTIDIFHKLKPPTQRLHAYSFMKAYEEIKLLTENHLLIVQNKTTPKREKYLKSRSNPQNDMLYSQHIINKFRKRTLTDIEYDLALVEAEQKLIESKVRGHVY